MSDEHADSETTGTAGTEVLEGEDAPESGEASTAKPAPSGYRQAGFALLRAAVVLVLAFVGYQLVVPTTHVVRTRLSRLVLSHPGITAFAKTQPQSGEQDDTQTGLTAVSNAAKKSPNKTGLYSIEWSPSQTSAAGLFAFLLPDDATATTTLTQIRAQQFAAGSYASNSLGRKTTFTVPGVPGSLGALYVPKAKSPASTPDLAAAVVRDGRIVAVADVIGATNAQNNVTTLLQEEYANLGKVEPGFTLSVTSYPTEATALWAAGAVILATIAALGPIAWGWRKRRRQARLEEEMAHRVVVRGQVIYKHRL